MTQNYSERKFDIILQGGQSNAEGCGRGPVDCEYSEDEDILYFGNDMTVSIAAEREWEGCEIGDFALSFAAAYKASGLLKPGRSILIIRAAVGGTGFCDHRWGMKDDLYLLMMEMIRAALAMNPENRLTSFIWHQGETDAGTPSAVHAAHLSGVVNSVRGEFGLPKLPFIAGDFCHEWKYPNIASCEPTVNGMIDACCDLGYSRFVLTDTLLSNNEKTGNGDTIHFCRDSLNKLGKRYFDAYRSIISF